MSRFLTEKATRAGWWEWPAMIFSGVLTAISLEVIVTNFSFKDFTATVFASIMLLALVGWPLYLTARKRLRRRQAEKLARHLTRLQGESITFGELGRRTGVHMPEDKLQWMISKGWIQNIALDHAHACVRLTGEGTPVVSAADEAAANPVELPDTSNAAFNEKLREIRALNDRIEDKSVSGKIDRIEVLTAGIFQLITEYPDRADAARRFMNYYLPTTFKLLESYSLMEKQPYQGQTIRASRQKIENVLDQIIHAIERQQDRMFQSDAMNVDADISVLQTMMSADGLIGNGGLHL